MGVAEWRDRRVGAEGEKPSSEPSATLWGSLSPSVPRTARAGDNRTLHPGRQRHRSLPLPPPTLPPQAWPWEQRQQLQIRVAEYKCFLRGEGREGSHS